MMKMKQSSKKARKKERKKKLNAEVEAAAFVRVSQRYIYLWYGFMALLHRYLVIALALKHVYANLFLPFPLANWCTRVGGVLHTMLQWDKVLRGTGGGLFDVIYYG